MRRPALDKNPVLLRRTGLSPSTQAHGDYAELWSDMARFYVGEDHHIWYLGRDEVNMLCEAWTKIPEHEVGQWLLAQMRLAGG